MLKIYLTQISLSNIRSKRKNCTTNFDNFHQKKIVCQSKIKHADGIHAKYQIRLSRGCNVISYFT